MTDSFERAVSFARGEYLIIIGDDDALLPHSLKILDGPAQTAVVGPSWANCAWEPWTAGSFGM